MKLNQANAIIVHANGDVIVMACSETAVIEIAQGASQAGAQFKTTPCESAAEALATFKRIVDEARTAGHEIKEYRETGWSERL